MNENVQRVESRRMGLGTVVLCLDEVCLEVEAVGKGWPLVRLLFRTRGCCSVGGMVLGRWA